MLKYVPLDRHFHGEGPEWRTDGLVQKTKNKK